MNALEELKRLLGSGTSRVSGTVIAVTRQTVTVQTVHGAIACPVPTVVVSSGDLVIVDSDQILYNLGKGDTIRRFDV